MQSESKEARARRVLITGGAGFLGQALVRELAAGHVRLNHHIDLVAYDLVDAPGIRTVRGDILDPIALKAALAVIDAVVHCAVAVDWSDVRAAHLENVNVRGTQTVLDACVAAGVPIFVHTSSMDVVCGDGDVHDATEATPYPHHFLDAYGRTKAESERRVRALSPRLATVILRFCAMYGEADPYKLPTMLREAKAGRLLFRIGDGSARMQPLYVGNAAVATLLALDRLLSGDTETKGRTLFVADHAAGNYFDWMGPILAGLVHPLPSRRLPGAIARLLGSAAEAVARPFGGRPALTRSSIQALCETITVDDRETRRLLGYEPPYGYDEAVARTVAWFQAQGEKS